MTSKTAAKALKLMAGQGLGQRVLGAPRPVSREAELKQMTARSCHSPTPANLEMPHSGRSLLSRDHLHAASRRFLHA